MRTLILLSIAVCSASLQQPTEDQLVLRLQNYLRQYRQQLSSLVATEKYQQRIPVHSTGGAYRVPAAGVETRDLISDLVLIGDGTHEHQWLGVRILNEINGRMVPESAARVRDILSTPGQDQFGQLKALAEENARMNLGDQRDINVPLVPLQLLDSADDSRLVYHALNAKNVRGVRCVGLGFSEEKRPTIIRTAAGSDLAASGTAWVEPETGVLHRVELRLTPVDRGGFQATTMDVEFSYNHDLGILVPTEMRETFAANNGVGDGIAHYANFRRFQTQVRIKQ